ncbi:10518_t:CDS:2 [Ambispora gerdemannii]|uniref:10518_t:CDS:1 n=1 Tax=Ambispora gerdemannii TaxID=144530 RepID=A0A9N8V4G9_9GLOM|nr:10518_t:CDS:2 [Ambispora gerdemannii]
MRFRELHGEELPLESEKEEVQQEIKYAVNYYGHGLPEGHDINLEKETSFTRYGQSNILFQCFIDETTSAGIITKVGHIRIILQTLTQLYAATSPEIIEKIIVASSYPNGKSHGIVALRQLT